VIAQGEFTAAYMVNRESNVFPGILVESAIDLRAGLPRGRIEKSPSPFADSSASPPTIATTSRRSCQSAAREKRQASPVSARARHHHRRQRPVAAGLRVVIFEQYAVPGGLMRTNIPAFRLPPILDEESATS